MGRWDGGMVGALRVRYERSVWNTGGVGTGSSRVINWDHEGFIGKVVSSKESFSLKPPSIKSTIKK